MGHPGSRKSPLTLARRHGFIMKRTASPCDRADEEVVMALKVLDAVRLEGCLLGALRAYRMIRHPLDLVLAAAFLWLAIPLPCWSTGQWKGERTVRDGVVYVQITESCRQHDWSTRIH